MMAASAFTCPTGRRWARSGSLGVSAAWYNPRTTSSHEATCLADARLFLLVVARTAREEPAPGRPPIARVPLLLARVRVQAHAATRDHPIELIPGDVPARVGDLDDPVLTRERLRSRVVGLVLTGARGLALRCSRRRRCCPRPAALRRSKRTRGRRMLTSNQPFAAATKRSTLTERARVMLSQHSPGRSKAAPSTGRASVCYHSLE